MSVKDLTRTKRPRKLPVAQPGGRMADDKKAGQGEQQRPREPLIVEVPTVLTRIDAQLKAQGTDTSTACSSSNDKIEQQRA